MIPHLMRLEQVPMMLSSVSTIVSGGNAPSASPALCHCRPLRRPVLPDQRHGDGVDQSPRKQLQDGAVAWLPGREMRALGSNLGPTHVNTPPPTRHLEKNGRWAATGKRANADAHQLVAGRMRLRAGYHQCFCSWPGLDSCH